MTRSEELFATVCMLTVDPSREHALIWLAGHPAPLLLGPPPRQLPDDLVGPALGVLPGVVWGRRRVPLGERWQLVLFSDGLVEGLSGRDDGERLGVDGLLDLIAQSPLQDTGELVDALIAEAQRRHGEPLPDDVAVLVLERRA